MSIKEKLEEKIANNEKKLREFSIHLQRLDREYQEILQELELSPEQLKQHIEDMRHLSPEIWEYLQNERKKLDEKLLLELSRISNPLKTQNTLSEQKNIQQHWLFVR